MNAHVPTMFLVIIAVGLSLATAIAFVATGRSRRLLIWASALGLHTLAYVLFSLRGQTSDFASIVLANVALAATVALFAEGVYKFQQRRAPRWLIWLPVVVIAAVFCLLQEQQHLHLRIVISGLVFSLQSLILLIALIQKRRQTVGRGQYILAAGAMLGMVMFALRAIATAVGTVSMVQLTANNEIQTATFLTSIITLTLVTIGLLLMITEQAEEASSQGKLFIQGILDSVPSQIAVIDHAGVIVDFNDAWRRFSLENGVEAGRPAPRTGVGANYLDVCGASGAAGSDDAVETSAGIRAVIEGRLPTFSIEYPCHSPQEQRWFLMTVTPLGGGKNGAVVAHYNITDRKKVEEQVRQLAYFDSLTQLPNRRMMENRLALTMATSKRSGLYGAVLLLDLDNFKPINDAHGHAAGDQLLIEVARRLKECVREADTVARLGGDEFVVVIEGLSADPAASREQATVIAEKIRASLAQIYTLAPGPGSAGGPVIEHRCSSSIGVTLLLGQDLNQDELLKQADAAMYQAKGSGRNAIRFFKQQAA